MGRETRDVQEMYMYVIAGSKTLILYLRNRKITGFIPARVGVMLVIQEERTVSLNTVICAVTLSVGSCCKLQ